MDNKRIMVKVCGMRERQNILDVCAMGPDFIGFIFYEKSPRYVGDHFTISHGVSGGAQRVGVFVNADLEEIKKRAEEAHLQVIQLHGSETPDLCSALQAEGFIVWKVFSIDERFDFETCNPYAGVCDTFLFDTKGKYYGGNAVTFDWKLLQQYRDSVPFILSGGLTMENISGVKEIDDARLIGIDCNSGVEVEPGIKDIEKVRRVIDLVRE